MPILNSQQDKETNGSFHCGVNTLVTNSILLTKYRITVLTLHFTDSETCPGTDTVAHFHTDEQHSGKLAEKSQILILLSSMCSTGFYLDLLVTGIGPGKENISR